MSTEYYFINSQKKDTTQMSTNGLMDSQVWHMHTWNSIWQQEGRSTDICYNTAWKHYDFVSHKRLDSI